MTFTPPPKAKPKRGKLVIIVAVLVFLLLAAAVVFAYLKRQQPATTNTANRQAPTVTTNDVDSASQSITTELGKVNDANDFTADDLSNKALGL